MVVRGIITFLKYATSTKSIKIYMEGQPTSTESQKPNADPPKLKLSKRKRLIMRLKLTIESLIENNQITFVSNNTLMLMLPTCIFMKPYL